MNELDINNPQLPDFIVPGADEKKNRTNRQRLK